MYFRVDNPLHAYLGLFFLHAANGNASNTGTKVVNFSTLSPRKDQEVQ